MPSLSVQESFSDNADLAPDDSPTEERNSKFTTRISPGVSIRARQGGRASLAVDYSNAQKFDFDGTSEDGSNNSNTLRGTANIEVWERVAFVDASASISQVVENTNEATSNSPAAEDINRTEARAFTISPNFRHHFGPWVDTLSTISYSTVSTESDVIEDKNTLSESLSISSGRRFTRVLWSIDSSHVKTSGGDEPSETSLSVSGSGTLVVNKAISLNSSFGWQKRENTGLDEDPEGPTWRAGFTARPGPRSSFDFSYGHQDDTNSFSFSGSHQISPLTSVSASYNESIQTSQGQLTDDLQFIVQDPNTGNLIDVRTGQPYTPNDAFGLEDDTFRQKRFSLSLSGTRGRSGFSVNGFWEERDIEAQNTVETSMGGGLNFTRSLTPKASGSIGLNYRSTDLGTADDQTENELSTSLGFSYRVGKDIQATVAYNFTRRQVNNAPSPEDMHENSVTVGLTKSF